MAIAAPIGAAIAAPSAGGIGLKLVDIPNGGKDPRARLYIIDHLAPGAVIHRRVEVSNTTKARIRVDLYSAAAAIADGGFSGAAGHTANDVSRWTSIAPGALDIPAGGRVRATVTVAVPRDGAPGEQYGAVWAEARSAVGGIAQASRVGVRLYLSIGPGGTPNSDFTIDALTAKRSPDGTPSVVATVHNTGGRALDMSGTLQLLAGPGGVSAGPFAATLGTTLAIGASEPVSVALDKALPTGKWDAEITLTSGLLERTARATITFPDAGASPAVKITPEGGGLPLPPIAGAAVLLFVLAAVVIALRRHARGRG